MNKERMTTLLLPKGEWLDALLVAFQVSGLELFASPRSYEYTFLNQALPVVFQAIRSKEVVAAVNDWNITANGGFTGTDIATEQRANLDTPRAWEFPLRELNPDAPNPQVYLGITPNLSQENFDLGVPGIAGTEIYTEYPSLTQQFLRSNRISATVRSVQGGSEGYWRINPRNGAIVTIRNTDATLRANEITPVQDILTAGVVYVESPRMSRQDQERVDDLQEALYLAARLR